MIRRALGLVALLTVCVGPANGNVLEVGATQRLKLPSEAAAVAKPGDIIRIAPGTYADCAIWRTDSLTIEATGNGAVLADRTCAGKGIFIVTGSNVTVRNLTFARAAVPDRNGAGILAAGHNLTVENSSFIGNENGILAAGVSGSVIRIVDSLFQGNGRCDPTCAHGVYAGAIDQLEIEHSRFIDQHVGHHIKSRARATVLIGNDIADGPNGNSSYLVDLPNGGDLLMLDNRLQKGPRSANPATVVAIGFEGAANLTRSLVVRGNTVISDLSVPTVFVSNRTNTPAILTGNHLQGRIKPLQGPGSVNP